MSDALSNAGQESMLSTVCSNLLDGSNFSNPLQNPPSEIAPSDSASCTATPDFSTAEIPIDWSRPCLREFEPPKISHRKREAWHWNHGFEAQEKNTGSKFWACIYCYRTNNTPKGFSWMYKDGAGSKGIRGHIKRHGWDEGGSIMARKQQQRETLLNSFRKQAGNSTHDSEIYHRLKTSFKKELFLRKLLRWVIHDDIAFDTVDSIWFRDMMLEANDSLADFGCLQTDETIKRSIIDTYKGYKGGVTEELRSAVGKIHISFDLWTSRNQLALCGVVAHFVNADYQMRNFLLSIPEIEGKHSGHNIAEIALTILTEFDILDRLGYTVTDNASNNDTALDVMANELDFNKDHKRLRCMGHIVNLIAKAVLYGKDPASLQKEIEQARKDLDQLKLWRSRGPIGRLHNVVKFILASPQRRKHFLNIQLQEDIECFVEAAVEGRSSQQTWLLEPDNDTRWNSTYKMICRAIELRQAIDAFIDQEIDTWEQYEKRQARKRARTSQKSSQRAANLDSSDDDNNENILSDEEDDADEVLNQQKRKRQPKKQPTIINDALSNEDWHALTEYKIILEPLWEATMRLEGEALEGRNGALWEVLPMFEYILDCFYQLDFKYQDDEKSISQPFHASLQLGIQKADDYYKKTDESPAYLAAVILHPQYKWQYIKHTWKDHQDWIETGKQTVRDLWENEYKHLKIENPAISTPQLQSKLLKRATGASQWLNKHLSSTTTPTYNPAIETVDEYDWYITQPQVLRHEDINGHDNFNPIQWWKSQKDYLPRLSKMAIDLLSTPAMSAKAERIFSHTGNIVRPNRARLQADTIGAVICLKQWDEEKVIDWFAGVEKQ
jgi:hypothetical protein